MLWDNSHNAVLEGDLERLKVASRGSVLYMISCLDKSVLGRAYSGNMVMVFEKFSSLVIDVSRLWQHTFTFCQLQ